MDFAPRLDTDRLRLTPMARSDFPFFWRLSGHRNVRQYLGGPVPWRRRLAQFQGYLSPPAAVGHWMVRPKPRAAAIGQIILSPHKDGHDMELSYVFHPAAWGHGFAREAALCVIDHALRDAGLTRIIAETQSANTASCRLLVRLGFAEVARLERFGAEQVIFEKSA